MPVALSTLSPSKKVHPRRRRPRGGSGPEPNSVTSALVTKPVCSVRPRSSPAAILVHGVKQVASPALGQVFAVQSAALSVCIRRRPSDLGINPMISPDLMSDFIHRPQIEVLSAADGDRRRHWSDDDKLRMVEESFIGHRQAAATARRHGICRSLLTTMAAAVSQRCARVCDRPGSFAPVTVTRNASAPQAGRSDPCRPAETRGVTGSRSSWRTDAGW